MKRLKKEEVVAQLSETLRRTQAVVVTDFKGLKVSELSTLRRKIGDAGGDYQVAKNTLIRLAAKGTGYEVLDKILVGNTALGLTEKDPANLAKALVEFAKTNDRLTIKGGALAGRLYSFEQVKAMADLPSREVLLSTLLGTMNQVPTGLVRVLAAVPQKLVYALAAIRDAKEGPAPEAPASEVAE